MNLKCKFLSTGLSCILFFSSHSFAQITIAFDKQSQPILFGVQHIEEALRKSGQQVQFRQLSSQTRNANITVRISKTDQTINKGGYKILRKGNNLEIEAPDTTGAMYAALDLAEQLDRGQSIQTIQSKVVSPRLSVRAIKFNLPWSSYRVGPAMQQHMETCRDLKFWQSFLDQMAENRFNVLSLWNVHPFSFMVKPVNFPEANNFSQKEMGEWKNFWTGLFRMARERGIETFIVNWNIAVSPQFAKAYDVQERNDTSATVKRYTGEVVTQVINEYPDLTGIGITLADWMSNFRSEGSTLPEMSPKDREDWIEETVVAGIKNAKRPVKFIHRSVLSADPKEMRRVIDNAKLPDTTLVEIKFNWSHGHSTPVLAITHDAHSGEVENGYWDPVPDNYRVQWMIRNEDFFILRWGQPDFIRKHIAENTKPYVNGYFVGSEGYIPANDFSHQANAHHTWDFAFQKQWLFYMVWGRLLYDAATPNAIFESAFERKYGRKSSRSLLKAYTAASNMPLRLASFHAATWDYTLYSEGFLSPFPPPGGIDDKTSSFISIDELIKHPVLDKRYLSIPDFVQATHDKETIPSNRVSPLQLADSLEKDSRIVLKVISETRSSSNPPTLACELDDLATWAYLSQYFAGKLRAGVALQTFRISGDKTHQQKAITLLESCMTDWKKICEITGRHYNEVPYVDDPSTGRDPNNDARTFSWCKYFPQVERDISVARNAAFK
jgi:hypothetical protein